MDYVLAIAEDRVPSTKEPDPYMHVFIDAGGGNILAFLERPTRPPMGRDANTPPWVHNIAFRVKDRATLLAYKQHLLGKGVDVLGPTDHVAFPSICFFDPDRHRLELACPDEDEAAILARMEAVTWKMLEDWNATRGRAHVAAAGRQGGFVAGRGARVRGSPRRVPGCPGRDGRTDNPGKAPRLRARRSPVRRRSRRPRPPVRCQDPAQGV